MVTKKSYYLREPVFGEAARSSEPPCSDPRGLPSWVHEPADVSGIPSQPQIRSTSTLLTIAAVADQLMLSTRTVRRMIARGQLKAVRLGRSVRIAPSALEMILNQNEINISNMLGDHRD
ncbi:helix-turn-helix domain-containing protein [Erythrobacter fulvus]|uniref:helix-turn-helix domain-containing protein n=1 Tax=Erythrobacter fulvus TaxID=2987523 RepID=UPI0035AB6E3F